MYINIDIRTGMCGYKLMCMYMYSYKCICSIIYYVHYDYQQSIESYFVRRNNCNYFDYYDDNDYSIIMITWVVVKLIFNLIKRLDLI